MVKSINNIEKYRKKPARRGPGRPSTVAVKVLVGLEADDVARLDAWIERQQKETGLKIGRGAAVRACMRIALTPK
jgi:cytochrome c553